MEIDILISPEKSFGSQWRFCSSLPLRARFSPQKTAARVGHEEIRDLARYFFGDDNEVDDVAAQAPYFSSNGMRRRPSSTQAS